MVSSTPTTPVQSQSASTTTFTFHPETQALLGALLWMKISKIGSGALRKLMALNPDLWHLWWHGEKHQLQLILSKDQIREWLSFQTHCPLNLATEANHYNTLGVSWIPFESPHFPPALREIYDPPAGLFVQGCLDGLLGVGQIGLAVVGTRKMTPYGQQMTQALVRGLKQSPLCIVSGLALGVDGAAHQAALEVGLPTVAFLGCGLDTCYPNKHAGLAEAILVAGGALVSEYPLGVQPLAKLFPRRNRLVVGVSVGVLIIEAPLMSGSMITAKLGIQENRTVMAIPHQATGVNAAGPLKLLKEGAGMVWESLHILQELGLAEATEEVEPTTQLTLNTVAPAEKSSPPVIEAPTLENSPQSIPENPEELLVWQALSSTKEPAGLSLEQLLGKLASHNMKQTEVAGHLTMLELEGWVRALAGGQFVANAQQKT
jgi:DNA processing protein